MAVRRTNPATNFFGFDRFPRSEGFNKNVQFEMSMNCNHPPK